MRQRARWKNQAFATVLCPDLPWLSMAFALNVGVTIRLGLLKPQYFRRLPVRAGRAIIPLLKTARLRWPTWQQPEVATARVDKVRVCNHRLESELILLPLGERNPTEAPISQHHLLRIGLVVVNI